MEDNRGITLVALVITIIVLLILAAVTLNLTLGEKGIFVVAQEARAKTEKGEIIEKAKLDIANVQTQNMGKFTEKELIEILNNYGTLSDNGEESILDKTLTTTNKKHQISVREIWSIPFESDNLTNGISFRIDCPDGKEQYGGSFTVDIGTTWKEFLSENFAGDWNGWLFAYDGRLPGDNSTSFLPWQVDRVFLFDNVEGSNRVFGYSLKKDRKIYKKR